MPTVQPRAGPRMPSSDVPTTARCTNCEAMLVGAYCHACGQSRADHLASLRGFAEHFAEAVLQYDSRALRTVRRLVVAPGALTADYLAGRRARYVGPVQCYALAAALLFLAGTVQPLVRFDARRAMFASRLSGAVGFTDALTAAERGALAARGVSLELFGERFVGLVTSQLSTLLIASVPLFALAVALVFVRRRRPFPHHVVFALHWSAFYLGVMSLVQLVPADGPFERAVGLTAFGWAAVYLALALRRVYGPSWGGVAWRTPVLLLAYLVVLLVWLESVSGYARRTLVPARVVAASSGAPSGTPSVRALTSLR